MSDTSVPGKPNPDSSQQVPPRPAAPMSPLPPLQEVPVDSILFVSFGGPEGPEDVIPFLENVLRGKNVPRERMMEVAEHYQHFGGVSPINEQCRNLIAAIETEKEKRGISIPLYWGNRNWHPLLPETMQQMKQDGKKRAIAFLTSMFSCYSGCRQYRENIADAQLAIGSEAPLVERIRMGFNHPKFIRAQADCLRDALDQFPEEVRSNVRVLFCAHSIPMTMASQSQYVNQLNECARLITESLGHGPWELVFQSRSGPPQQPWLEPDVCDRIEQLSNESQLKHVVVMPLGFISDHMEVLYDLDEEAAQTCKERNIHFVRGKSVGTHPDFVSMIVDLIEERLQPGTARPSIGQLGPVHDICPGNCCLYPAATRPAR